MQPTHIEIPKAKTQILSIPERVAFRVATKVEPGFDGCLLSTYSTGSHGYAQVGWNEAGKRFVTLCHRVVWIHQNGAITPGMTVDHICKQRRCVNIEHLRLLTNYENARRTAGRDWPLGQCANGHDNSHLGLVDGGRTKCLICYADWHRNFKVRHGLRVSVAAA